MAEPDIAKLPKGQEPMSDEDWEIHKDCDAKKREHKWHWKLDIATGLPSPTQAICAHCGVEKDLRRD